MTNMPTGNDINDVENMLFGFYWVPTYNETFEKYSHYQMISVYNKQYTEFLFKISLHNDLLRTRHSFLNFITFTFEMQINQ